MIGKNEMAEVFADFVKKHHSIFSEKSKDEIISIVKRKWKGVSNDAIQNYSSAIFDIFSKFLGMGIEEIKMELDLMSQMECDHFHNIAIRLTDFI